MHRTRLVVGLLLVATSASLVSGSAPVEAEELPRPVRRAMASWMVDPLWP